MLEPQVAHHQADINGIQLHYVEAGRGPLAVLLHGFPDFWYSWRFQIPYLAAAGFHVVAPDLRGYNKSEKPPGVAQYHLKFLTEDVISLIRHLGRERAVVVAHDWGGVIAWSVAKDYPKVVDRLVVMNSPHPALFLREFLTFGQLMRTWHLLVFQLPWLPEALIPTFDFALLKYRLSQDSSFKKVLASQSFAAYKAALSEPGALRAAINYYRAAFRDYLFATNWKMTPIVVPTLLIWGEEDRYLGPGFLRGLERWVVDLRVERMPGAGHWVHWEAHEAVNNLLVGFLKDRQGSS